MVGFFNTHFMNDETNKILERIEDSLDKILACLKCIESNTDESRWELRYMNKKYREANSDMP